MRDENLPLVSAIIPVYNGEKYLAETIGSILGQSYPNIECIVVDDGSTDGTANICAEFGERIRYIRKENGGVSSARNRGIEESNGEFVAFLDADDKWAENKIERQVEEMTASDAGLCLTGVGFIDGSGNVIGENGIPDADAVVENILTLSAETGFIATTGLARLSAFEAVGLFDENLSTAADADMVLRFAVRSEILTINEPLGIYRHHTGQMHHNLDLFERDMNRLLDRFFRSDELPAKYATLKSVSHAALESSLSIGKLRRYEVIPAIRHFFLSLWLNPATPVVAYSRVVFSKAKMITKD